MEKYSKIVALINREIGGFNANIALEWKVRELPSDLLDDRAFVSIRDKEWKDTRWPNQEFSGVYFLFGYNKINPNEVGVYIGKASLRSKIGNRIYEHLNKDRPTKDYKMNDGHGNTFALEYTSGINFEENNTVFLAPALEEYLIGRLGSHVHLLNVSGNKRDG